MQKGCLPVDEDQLVEDEALTVGELMVIHYRGEGPASSAAGGGDGGAAKELKKGSDWRVYSTVCLIKRAMKAHGSTDCSAACLRAAQRRSQGGCRAACLHV